MSQSLFVAKPPKDYVLTEISWEKWVRGLYKEGNLSEVKSKAVLLRRVDATLQRFLDKPRNKNDRDAVHMYMVDEIGQVELMNKLNMTKLQRVYLWPILPSITGYIAGNVSEQELKVVLHKFYVDAMTGGDK